MSRSLQAPSGSGENYQLSLADLISDQGMSAVNGQHSTGDPAAVLFVIAGKQKECTSDVLGFADLLQWGGLDEALAFLGLEIFASQIRHDPAGSKDVHSDLIFAQFHGKCAGHVSHCGLGNGVTVRADLDSGGHHGSHIDD